MTPQHRPVQTAGRAIGAADLTRERLADRRAALLSGELSSASLPRPRRAGPSEITRLFRVFVVCSSVTVARAAGSAVRSVAA
ncbi:hypothetical protein GCM10022254_32210 [Actinomadura meridiana]|uniref:Uncharacterized protein n=1 Tax=Actinomadura meridiana TaxID=559626 RepID=A0ABP8C3A5_9ACTN